MTHSTEQDLGAPAPALEAMAIYRRSSACTMAGKLTMDALTPDMMGWLGRMVEAQGPDAAETTYLWGGLGMSLSTAWFKSGYVVPLHSHNADCLYYIVTGSLRLGTEELGPGDGFVVPFGVPYTYSAGPEGVEVLEFRTAETFDIRMASAQPTYWTRLLDKLSRARPRWAGEPRPQRKVAD